MDQTITAERDGDKKPKYTDPMQRLAVGFVLFIALLLRLPGFTMPFLFPHEEDNALYSQAARNLLRHDLAGTRGHASRAVAGEMPGRENFYLNHQPALAWLIAGAHLLVGPHDWATRLVPILFSLLGLIILHDATRRRWGERVALYALILAAFLPLSAYYGRVVKFETIILPFGILAIDQGLNRSGRRGVAMFALAFACLVDYGAFLLIPGLVLMAEDRRRLFPLLALATAILMLHFAMIFDAGGSEALRTLFLKGAERGGLAGGFTWADFLRRQIGDHLFWTITPLGLLALLGGLVMAILRSRKTAAGEKAPERFLMALGAWGSLYILVFREAAMHHDYWQYYLIPTIVILIALLLDRLRPRIAILIIIPILISQSARILERRYYRDIGWYAREFAAIEFARHVAPPKSALLGTSGRAGASVLGGDRMSQIAEGTAWPPAAAPPTGPILTREPMRSSHPLWYADRPFVHAPQLGETRPYAIGIDNQRDD
jgi:4-amino-4-deoxy-L-arabinose transferase-like glycosyltransferase